MTERAAKERGPYKVSRLVLGTVGAMLLGAVAASCERLQCKDQSNEGMSGAEVCDYVVRPLSPSACGFPKDCPLGTICVDPPTNSGSGASDKKICALPEGLSARQALISGFQVAQFPLNRANDGTSASFSWEAPEDARIVHCALFACRPDIRSTGCDGPNPTYKIENYSLCAIADQVFEPADGLFDLGDPQIAVSPPENTCSSRVVTELLVGCWAYDESRIIAATRLESLLPDEVYDYGGFLDPTCSDATDAGTIDGGACVLDAQTRRIGMCHQGACVKPCVAVEDCEASNATDAGTDASVSEVGDASDASDASDGGDAEAVSDASASGLAVDAGVVSKWSCVVPSGHFVGACVLNDMAEADAATTNE